MKRFVEGEGRSQSTLFPERLDDYVGEDNPVRVVDVFVEELDLGRLDFAVDASVIEADASRFQRIKGRDVDWAPEPLSSRLRADFPNFISSNCNFPELIKDDQVRECLLELMAAAGVPNQ